VTQSMTPSKHSARHRVARRAPSRYAVIAFALVVSSLTAGSAAVGLAVRSQSHVVAGPRTQLEEPTGPIGGSPPVAPSSPASAAPAKGSSPPAGTSSSPPATRKAPTGTPHTTGGASVTGPPVVASATVTSAGATPSATPSRPLNAQEQAVLELTNAARQKQGCAPLRVDDRLEAAAQAHAADMASRHYFSHVSPEGLDPSARARAAGFPSGAGENIAMGFTTASVVMDGWMGSRGHRANILNCSYTVIGVGYDPRTIKSGFAPGSWVQMFGVL